MRSKPVGQRKLDDKKKVPRLVPVKGGILTFTPLHRGRFRCNQTGAHTRCPERYVSMNWRTIKAPTSSLPLPSAKPKLLKARLDTYYHEVRCPHSDCGGVLRRVYDTGRKTCPSCGKELEAF